MLSESTPEVQQGEGVVIEVFASFLAGFGRKVYRVAEGKVFQIPARKAHAHGNIDMLCPVSGEIWVAYTDAKGQIDRKRLEPGKVYRIPPNVPHQVEIRGGILEALFPTPVYTRTIPMRYLEGGFFQNLNEDDQSGVEEYGTNTRAT
jgi:hypothetical protein